jgi:hypothetical protein
MENDAQKAGGIASMVVPVGAAAKVAGTAAKGIKGADAVTDAVKAADAVTDATKRVDTATDAAKGADTLTGVAKARTFDELKAILEEAGGIKAVRIRPGDTNKIAVIGRNMADAVEPYSEALRAKGIKMETFNGDMISETATKDWLELKAFYSPGRIPDDATKSALMYSENQKWAKKLADEGYTIVDVGNPGDQGTSLFYEMEKNVLFGDDLAGIKQ